MTLQPTAYLPPAEYVHEPPRPPEHEAWLRVYEPMIGLAERLAFTAFVPESVRRNKNGAPRERSEVVADTFAILLCGHGIGLAPIQALQSIAMINGKPFVLTEVVLALALREGHVVHFVQTNDKSCTVRGHRRGATEPTELTYTFAQAQKAGLTKKDNWQNRPDEMLRARAARGLLKMIAPDVALGLDTAETPVVAAVESPSGLTVVQVQTPPRPASERLRPEPLNGAPEVQGELQNTVTVAVPAGLESNSVATVSSPPVAVPPPDMITGPQRRKIGALIGQLEKHDGHRMDRQERRDFIAALLEVEHLESANDLTKSQAGDVIDRLEALLADAKPAEDAEIVDAEVVE